MSTFTGSFLDERIEPVKVDNSVSVIVFGGGSNRPSPAADVLLGNDGDDTLDGGGGDDTIDGGAGFDSIEGSAGNDDIDGGLNADVIFGELGDDTIKASLGDVIDGGDDDDLLQVFGVALTLVGGDGDDTLEAQGAEDLTTTVVAGIEALALDGNTLTLTALQLANFDRIVPDDDATLGVIQIALFGTMGNAVQVLELDELVVTGSAADDELLFTTSSTDPTNMTLMGGSGSDTLTAGAGDDFLNGDGVSSFGEDVLSGGDGDDRLTVAVGDTAVGGAGDDTIRYTGPSGNQTSLLDGGSGTDRLDLDGTVALAAATIIVGLEELALDQLALTLTPAQLNAFDRIVAGPGASEGRIALSLSGNASAVVTELARLIVEGTAATDILTFTTPDGAGVRVEAGAGNDIVTTSGDGGDDTLVGGDGADTLGAGEGANVVRGGEGDDVVSAGTGADVLQGGEGDDVLVAGDRDTVQGGDGADRIKLGRDGDPITANLQGGSAEDTLVTAGAGPTVLATGTTIGGIEVLELGNLEGTNDTLTLTAVQLDAFERLIADATSVPRTGRLFLSEGGAASIAVEDFLALVVTGSATDDTLTFSAFATDITVRAGNGDDTIAADLGADVLDGGAGDDVLVGSDPFATAGTSNDTLSGGAGADTLFATDGDEARGGAGDDFLFLDDRLQGSDVVATATLTGGADTDTLVVTASGIAAGVLINGIERLALTSSRLSLSIEQLNAFETVVQHVAGTAGLIELTTSGSADVDVAELETLAVFGSGGADDLSFTATGDVETEILVDAREGDDTVATSTGDDDIFGGEGNDVLRGQAGADLLVGGSGSDELTGGGGDDIFRFEAAANSSDIISDFAQGADRIEVSATGFGGGLVSPSFGGSLTADRLVVRAISNATSPEGTGQFIFNTNLSLLLWDADGAGGSQEIPLCELEGLTTLALSDLRLID